MTNLQHLFTSAEQATAFTEAQRTTLQRRNEDLRTLGQSKALHALAESLGYTNWHAMKHALDALASKTPAASEETSSPQTKMALSLLEDIDALSQRYDSLDDVDDVDELQALHDELDGEGLLTAHNSELTACLINITLGSGIKMQLEVVPGSQKVVGAHVRVSGFEGTISKQVPSEHLDALGRRFADQIEGELLSLITG